jgi:hypothetical protein
MLVVRKLESISVNWLTRLPVFLFFHIYNFFYIKKNRQTGQPVRCLKKRKKGEAHIPDEMGNMTSLTFYSHMYVLSNWRETSIY